MTLPGCCLRALKRVIFCLGVIAMTTLSVGAPLFTCESGGGGAVAQASILYVHVFGEFELDFDGRGNPLHGCTAGSVSASAAARSLGYTGTGQSTYSVAINTDGIVMTGSASGTAVIDAQDGFGFYAGGGGRAGGRLILRIPERVMATVRITDDGNAFNTFRIGITDGADPLPIPADTAGTWTFPICPTNGAAILDISGNTSSQFQLAVTFVRARPEECLQVGLRALEVTQSIQDWSNSVPLIEKKPTFVRAHLQAINPADVGKTATAKLRGFRGGSEMTGSPLSPATEFPFIDPAELAGDAAMQRNETFVRANNSTLNFALPESWRSGTIRMYLEAQDSLIVPMDPPEPGGQSHDGVVTLSFMPVARPTVVFSPIRVIRAGGQLGPYPDQEEIREALLTAWSMFPVDRFILRSGQPLYVDLRSPTALGDQLNNVVGLRRFGTGPLGNALGIGIVSAAEFPSGFDTKGEAQPSLGVAWATTTSRDTLPHEIGHLLGRPHAANDSFPRVTGEMLKQGSCCEFAAATARAFPYFYPLPDLTANYGCVSTTLRPSLGPLDLGEDAKIYGLQRLANTFSAPLSPSNTFELMSYCGAATKWISVETYRELLTAISSRWGVSPAPSPFAIAQALPPQLIIRGFVNVTADTIEWLPFQCFSDVADLVTTPSGEYEVRMLDGANAVLAETSFAALLPDDFEAAGDDYRAPFVAALPFNPSSRRVEIRRGGVLKAAATASPNLPLVELLAPNGGETLEGEEFDVRWEVFDVDGDTLSFTLEYSADNGATWNSLGTDLRGTNLVVDVPGLKGGAAARFRVLASDGFHCTMDESDGSFQVTDRGPEVFIRYPADHARFYARQSVHLHGFALDKEDGELLPDSLEWRSDLDGVLGSGEEVFVKASQLTEGVHRISLTGRDSGGRTSSVTNTVFIHRAAPPQLRVAGRTGNTTTLEVSGTVPSRTLIETSSNLVDWTPSQVFTQANRLEVRNDVALPEQPARFFRARAESLPLPVEGAPQLIVSPPHTTALQGGQTTLSVLAAGEVPLSYQWTLNGTAIAGATNASLFLTNIQSSAAGTYALTISNAAGVIVSSNITVTVIARTFETLHRFGPLPQDGINGWGQLAVGSDGALYGCVRNGGPSNAGAIFRIETTGSNYSVLHHFAGGAGGSTPLGGIIEASDGALYGTTFSGGTNNSGLIFRLNKDGTAFTVLRHFLATGDCRNPQSELLEASDGALYGTAYNGGGFGRGGVFRINKNGSGYAIVSGLNFGGTEAPSQPVGGLIEAPDGFLYGTSELGGATTNGTIFKLSKDGASRVVLKSLGIVAGGAEQPNGTLVLGNDGQLYGTAAFGGANNFGAIFSIATNGTNFAVIKSLGSGEGREPRTGLLKTFDGALIGTTRIGGDGDGGALYQFRVGNEFPYAHLVSLGGAGNGTRPRGPLVDGKNGFCYGTTFGGGTNDQGTIFRYWLGN
jgi:uncharacterized repeat protein (TIGR03803 family)